MSGRPPDPIPDTGIKSGPLKLLFVGLGFIFVGIGSLGVLVPGLPTTPFMLLAAWMFSKSSARFHAWLWNHRVFGPYVRAWAQHRVIPMHAKVISLTVMAVGLGLLVHRDSPMLLVALTAAVCVWGAVFILRCPSRVPARVER